MSSFSFNGARSKSKPTETILQQESPNQKKYSKRVAANICKTSSFLKPNQLSEFTSQFKSKISERDENLCLKSIDSENFPQFISKNSTIEKSNLGKAIDSDKLESFLREIGISKYMNLLKENEISYDDLALLTRDDLIDLKLPIGPRNRLLIAIKEKFENIAKEEIKPLSQIRNGTPHRYQIKEENDIFIPNLAQVSNKFDAKERPSSRQSIESISSESLRSPINYDEIVAMLNNMREQQNIMLKAIEENQRVVTMLCQSDYLQNADRQSHSRKSSGYNGNIY
ncbi:unnamed protein product [Blepharisma stoltei]|uniref:SAM domain-containing protein n=1 Tax=Blepharisma stoltei TaxID=1481888 RepID=A0AAU9KKX4_9CILI|nr:unnamed protein product [Blepharisma stoltei]